MDGACTTQRATKGIWLWFDVGMIRLASGLVVLVMAGMAEEVRHTDTKFTWKGYATRAEWETRAAFLRQQVRSAAGLLPMPEKRPMTPQIFGRINRGEYTIEKVLLETWPGYYLSGNLYRPAKAGKHPGIASPHGHWNYGRLEHSQHGSVPARCVNLARQGFVVFAYDMVGYNDTVQTPHAFGWNVEDAQHRRQMLWSFTPLGLQLWNSIRVVDFLTSLPDVDAERIGATGASGGGTQTFLLAAVDERVKFTAPVNMISGIMQGGSPCENAPGLRFDTYNVELAALTAPRPMIMVSATGDWTRNTPRDEYPAMQSIYRLYDREALLETVQIDAPHNYNQASREAVYQFFAKHVMKAADPASVRERPFPVEPLADMLVLHNRTLPAQALTFEQLFESWKAASRRQAEAIEDTGLLRERLRHVLGVDPARDTPGELGEGIRSDVRIAQLGLRPYEEKRESKQLRYFHTFNRSTAAEQVQTIVTALVELEKRGDRVLKLECQGGAAVACTFAAAVAPLWVKQARIELVAPLGSFTGSDEDFLERFFVPGIQRAGGLEAARRLLRR